MGCMFTLVRFLSNLRVASCKYIHLKSNIASKKMEKQSSMLNNLGSYVNGACKVNGKFVQCPAIVLK